MAGGFQSIHFNVADKQDEDLPGQGTRSFALRGAAPRAETAERGSDFNNDEAAARFYLGKLLAGDVRPAMRSLTAPEQAQVVPDLRLQDAQLSPLTNTRMVRFEQTKTSI